MKKKDDMDILSRLGLSFGLVQCTMYIFCLSHFHFLWGFHSQQLQSGASSQAKHGGAYFSAVYGSIEDPMAAPGPCENLGPPFLGGSAQPVTFVLPLTHTQLPLINGHSSRICSEAGLMYLFGDKYIRPVPEQILLQCPLRSGSSVCMCEGQNKSDRLSTATQKWGS